MSFNSCKNSTITLRNTYPGRICDAISLQFNRAAATGKYDQYDTVWAKPGTGPGSDVYLQFRFEVNNSSVQVPVDSLRRDCGLCSMQDLDLCSKKSLGEGQEIPIGDIPKFLDSKLLCDGNVIGSIKGSFSGAKSLGYFAVLTRFAIFYFLINAVLAQPNIKVFASRSIVPLGKDGWNPLLTSVHNELNAPGFYGTGRRELDTLETTSCQLQL
jgi:hypothetical protein